MAFLRTTISSYALMGNVSVDLYFPTDLPEEVGNKINGVLTLLHGFYGCHTDWGVFSSAQRYAADNGFVLVMPSANNSFYNDMLYGGNYYTFISEELPYALSQIFNLPLQKEKNFIAGLSMGGYGALRVALANPEQYAACASFSGPLDMPFMIGAAKEGNPFAQMIFTPVFGEEFNAPEEASLVYLAKNIAKLPKVQQPLIFLTCASQDNDEQQIRTQNENFLSQTKGLSLDINYRQWSGEHEWAFWDRSLAEFFGFIQNSNYTKQKMQDWANAITVQKKEQQQ